MLDSTASQVHALFLRMINMQATYCSLKVGYDRLEVDRHLIAEGKNNNNKGALGSLVHLNN